MRVIAGALKGRRLRSPSWPGLRPTSDKLRETLFNILAPRVAGARVLDGYAGTGALGIEARSRGAASVMFVDDDRRAQALIEQNLARCGIANGCVIIRASVARALARWREAEGRFDIVLLDPPYDTPIDNVLVATADVLADRGIVVLEHATRRPSPSRAGSLVRTREVTAGDSSLSFYEKLKTENDELKTEH